MIFIAINMIFIAINVVFIAIIKSIIKVFNHEICMLMNQFDIFFLWSPKCLAILSFSLSDGYPLCLYCSNHCIMYSFCQYSKFLSKLSSDAFIKLSLLPFLLPLRFAADSALLWLVWVICIIKLDLTNGAASQSKNTWKCDTDAYYCFLLLLYISILQNIHIKL